MAHKNESAPVPHTLAGVGRAVLICRADFFLCGRKAFIPSKLRVSTARNAETTAS